MHWFFIALAAPFLWGLVNVADNYLVSRFSKKEEEKSSGALVLFSSLIGLVIAFLIWIATPGVFHIPVTDMLLLLVAGALAIVWIIFYLFALEIEETSSVVPWFLSVPVFGYILGYFVLGETLTLKQILASIIILIGAALISFDFSEGKHRFKHKPVLYMLLASITVAVSGIIFKYVTVEDNFWISSFWEYLGLGLSGLLIFLFIPRYREAFLHMNRAGGRMILTINIVSELASILGNLLSNYALLLAPVAMVFLVGSFQPAIVLILSIIGTKFLPHIIKENISRKTLVYKIIAIVIMILGSSLLFL